MQKYEYQLHGLQLASCRMFKDKIINPGRNILDGTTGLANNKNLSQNFQTSGHIWYM